MEMIGFYREMDPENDAVFREPIGDKVRDRTPYPKAEIKRYLDSGHPIFDIMELRRAPWGSAWSADRVGVAAHPLELRHVLEAFGELA
ncbi:hypothetical protein ACFCXF_00100 [Streptomyces virginiae]|uniref:hypothetical protein n=1 Tax=Streptomyces virginiae TaxID=1961 RepID=UPI0035E0797D